MPYFNASTTQLSCNKRTNLDNTNSLNRNGTCNQQTSRASANIATKTMPNRIDRHQAGLSTPSGVPLFQITINSKNNNCDTKTNDTINNKKKRSSTTLAELENLKNSSKNQTEISNFLKRINMNKYELKFISNGFDDINFLVNLN